MADTEFEEFRHSFEKLPSHIKAPAPFYSLVHDVNVDEESPTSSKSDPDTDCDILGEGRPSAHAAIVEDKIAPPSARAPLAPWKGPGERRRRKLPEIPKNKKSTVVTLYSAQISREMSLADELGGSGSGHNSLLVLKCSHLWDNDSPDSERVLTDADSGHSTAHSPTDGPKSMSPLLGASPACMGGGTPYSDVEMLEATHRGLHKFIPRHEDEIEVEIGDPIYVQKEADDLWCEGVNLRTGRMGIFPSAYAVDCDYSDWDSTCEHGRRERYVLGYLGSVETLAHKGTSVVCQAVRRVVGSGLNDPEPQPCILEVSDQGLRMVDRRKRNQNEPCIDYFYSLKNVSFCAFHPRDHRYLGFITKHPTLQRFACHVFRGTDSTRPVAEGVGYVASLFVHLLAELLFFQPCLSEVLSEIHRDCVSY
ncbi:SH3 domain-containing protein [Oryctes borbonicus]|uniref:SH3 domain-containing protein n=1 Tax=Oryctes borbonicus TaxID=1629725 RepID=A0A0T6B2P9_9SCAR|nr:SH3 domain-containing protein [Oryctes borbonicus]